MENFVEYFLGLMILFHLLVNCLPVVSINCLYVCRVCFVCSSYQRCTVVLYCTSSDSEWSCFQRKKKGVFQFFSKNRFFFQKKWSHVRPDERLTSDVDSVPPHLMIWQWELKSKGGPKNIHFKTTKGHVSFTTQLFAPRSIIDLQMNDGRTPLHCATENGHESVTKQLVQAHCNIDLQEENDKVMRSSISFWTKIKCQTLTTRDSTERLYWYDYCFQGSRHEEDKGDVCPEGPSYTTWWWLMFSQFAESNKHYSSHSQWWWIRSVLSPLPATIHRWSWVARSCLCQTHSRTSIIDVDQWTHISLPSNLQGTYFNRGPGHHCPF